MRRLARETALQILFQSEFSHSVPFADLLGLLELQLERETLAYCKSLVEGVTATKIEIDKLIQSKSAHWSIQRMSAVDRNVIRIALFEMKFSPEEIKPNIAINEAVEIARKFGTTESASFVNGLLDALSKETNLR